MCVKLSTSLFIYRRKHIDYILYMSQFVCKLIWLFVIICCICVYKLLDHLHGNLEMQTIFESYHIYKYKLEMMEERIKK